MSKSITLTKIPLSSLIQVLTQLYEEGADYIDISGELNPASENDIIKLTVKPEYYLDSEEENSETDPEYLFTEEIEPTKEDINPISDDDINDLI